MEILFCAVLILYQIVILCLLYYLMKYNQLLSKLELRVGDGLRYVGMLIETVYTFKNNPESLRDHLLHEMTVNKLLSYHLVEDDEGMFPPELKCTKKDRLLYKLHLEGFSPRELCILFELNNLNTVYVKCHRMNKRLHLSKDIARCGEKKNGNGSSD